MRVRKFIPAVLAFILLAGVPLASLPACDSAAGRGNLACYCRADAGKTCSLQCCSTGKVKSGTDAPRGPSEMILNLAPAPIPGRALFAGTDRIPAPEMVYLEVPVRPPIPA